MAFTGGAQAPGSTLTRPRHNSAQRRAGLGGQRTGNHPRARQRQLPSIYDPAQQLAGRPLRQAANALTDLEIRPQVSQLARQIANINRQSQAAQSQTAGWFRDLGDQAQQAFANQQTASRALNASLAGIGTQTQQQIGDAGQQAEASLAPLQATGLGGGGFEQLVREIAAQRSLAAQNSQTAQDFGVQQGGNFEGLTASQMGTGALRGQERLSELGNAFALQAQEPQARMAELIGQRGSLFTKNLGALRDSERNYGLARDTLGVTQQNNLLDARNSALDRRQRARSDALDRQARLLAASDRSAMDRASFLARWGITPEALAALPNPGQWLRGHSPYYTSRGSGGRKPLTRGQANTAFTNIDTATRIASSMLRDGNGTGYIRDALSKGYYEVPVTDRNGTQVYDSSGAAKTKRISVARVGNKALVNAALELATRGTLSRASVRALHRYGLTIGGRYRYDNGARQTGGAVSGAGRNYGGF